MQFNSRAKGLWLTAGKQCIMPLQCGLEWGKRAFFCGRKPVRTNHVEATNEKEEFADC